MKNPKVKVVLLLVGGLVLVIGTAFLAVRLAQTTSPEDTSATGFGRTATRDLFAPVATTFSGIRCNTLFNTNLLELTPNIQDDIKSIELVNEVAPFQDLSKWCEYDIGGGRKITFSLLPYSAESDIDSDREALYTRINGELLYNYNIYAHDNWFNVDYYLGEDAEIDNGCRTNLFHFQNDFEYASIHYEGFSQPCYSDSFIEFNDAVASIFSENISVIMDTINLEYGVTFENLFLDYDFNK